MRQLVVKLLALEAQAVLRVYQPRIAAVTGSVGKTSAKDALYCVISARAYARKSHKSFNSELGLPLTILGRPNAWNNPLRWAENLIDGLFLIFIRGRYPEWLVLEIGADRPGDIKSVAQWLRVDIAVITRLPDVPVHVEFFDSPEEVAEEKASLIDALKPDGTLVLYADDERVRALAARAEGKKIVLFGLSHEAQVRAEATEVIYEEGAHARPVGMRAQLAIGEEAAPLELLGVLGRHALLPLLAAAAAGTTLGRSLSEILEDLTRYAPPPGRMHLLPGIKDTTIIDDSYNSSPAAALAALDALKEAAKGRKIAVLGDMSELGRYSAGEHRKVGAQAAHTADLLLTVGIRARGIAEGALNAGMRDENIFQYEDAQRAGEELQNMLTPGDTVLIKGSQVMRMERVVQELMQEPERAEELLVRQDKEWRQR